MVWMTPGIKSIRFTEQIAVFKTAATYDLTSADRNCEGHLDTYSTTERRCLLGADYVDQRGCIDEVRKYVICAGFAELFGGVGACGYCDDAGSAVAGGGHVVGGGAGDGCGGTAGGG